MTLWIDARRHEDQCVSSMVDMAPSRDWHRALLTEDSTLQDAITNLEVTGMQISLIADPRNALVGIVTDGDIRRGLLRGLSLSDSIGSIIHRDPLVVPPQFGREMVLQLMQANMVHQLPVVDENRCIVGLHLLDELMSPEKKQNIMVIMAGGMGTRLRPHTEKCPKPLLPVAGKPMLEHIIERARSEGFQKFIIAIHYLGEMIEEYFGDGGQWGVQIDYLREKSPLGTAGAIGLMDPRPDRTFVVTNGDVLTDIRYSELIDFHGLHEAAATMAVRMHEWQHPFGVVKTRGVDIVGFDEKPVMRSHINAGVYALEPSILDLLVKDERCDMPTLFGRLQETSLRTIVYPMHEPWLDVGSPKDYKQANKNQDI